jgi:hypothetical protein
MQKIVSCGTLRGVFGGVLLAMGFAYPSVWWLAAIGASLVWWALWAVAQLEKKGERHD